MKKNTALFYFLSLTIAFCSLSTAVAHSSALPVSKGIVLYSKKESMECLIKTAIFNKETIKLTKKTILQRSRLSNDNLTLIHGHKALYLAHHIEEKREKELKEARAQFKEYEKSALQDLIVAFDIDIKKLNPKMYIGIQIAFK